MQSDKMIVVGQGIRASMGRMHTGGTFETNLILVTES